MATYPALVLIVSTTIVIYMATAALNPVRIEDERMAWTPIGNPSLKAKEKAEALYSSSGGTGFISMIGIAKFPNTTENPNILTRATFQELIDFE